MITRPYIYTQVETAVERLICMMPDSMVDYIRRSQPYNDREVTLWILETDIITGSIIDLTGMTPMTLASHLLREASCRLRRGTPC
jgi:hypothetical protein